MNLTQAEAAKLSGSNISALVAWLKERREKKVRALCESVDEKESDKLRGAIGELDQLAGIEEAIKNPLST